MKTHHRLAGLLAIVSLGIGLSTLGRAQEGKGGEKTFVGHVVDLACYIGTPALRRGRHSGHRNRRRQGRHEGDPSRIGVEGRLMAVCNTWPRQQVRVMCVPAP